MTRYYSPTCFADTPEGKKKKIEGWHTSLQKALWCHAINNTKVHPLDAICAKDADEPKRLLDEEERKEVIDITSASPWKLTLQQIQDVIKRTPKPPWELEVGRPRGGPSAIGCIQCC